jgi:hypothetical protein
MNAINFFKIMNTENSDFQLFFKILAAPAALNLACAGGGSHCPPWGKALALLFAIVYYVHATTPEVQP